jgi:hypothetical protein
MRARITPYRNSPCAFEVLRQVMKRRNKAPIKRMPSADGKPRRASVIGVATFAALARISRPLARYRVGGGAASAKTRP